MTNETTAVVIGLLALSAGVCVWIAVSTRIFMKRIGRQALQMLKEYEARRPPADIPIPDDTVITDGQHRLQAMIDDDDAGT